MQSQRFIADAPQNNLINKIIYNLIADGKDYSRNMVIFPNRRPAHFLRKELAKEIQTSFIPPVIFSIDDFIDHVYEHENKDIKLDALDAVSILYKLQRESSSPIGERNFLEPDSFFPLGLKIYSDIEELFIEKIPLSQVKEIDQLVADIPIQTLDRLKKLSYFYKEFYEKTTELGYSSRSSRYRKVSEQIKNYRFSEFERIILAGFFALTRSEKDIFKNMLSRDNTLLIFKDGTGIGERLAEIGINYKSACSEGLSLEIHFYSSPDTHGQVFGLSRLIKNEIERGSHLDEKSLAALPSSDTLFPVIHNCLSLLSPDSYNISMGYPLHRTPIFGFINNLMELITSINDDKVYIPDYLRFVLHPYIKNIHLDNKIELTRIIFHTIEDELSAKRMNIFLSLREIENDEKLLNIIFDKFTESGENISKEKISNHIKTIHEKTINKFTFFRDTRDFSEKCRELLLYIYNESTARLHPLFYPFSEAFLDSLQRIDKSLIKDISFSDTKGYFTFFRRYIMTCNTPFEGTPLRGLQVLGFLETRNLSFDNVYMLDVNEDILPAANKEKSLIPFMARKNLGLPTYIDSDKIFEYYFEILLKGAKNVHIFFVENDSADKSRFIEKMLWEMQKKDCQLDSKRYIKSIQYDVSLRNPAPKKIIKTGKVIEALQDFTYSASALDSYLVCGLRFYYNHILDLQKKQEITGDFEKSDIGSLVHNALQKYFKQRKGENLSEQNLSPADLDNILDSLFKEYFGSEPSGSAYLIKRQIKKHLHELLKKYYIQIVKNNTLKIIDCEYKIDIRVNSYKLKGRLDSIEKRNDKTVIIDYKTSSSPSYYTIRFDKLNIHDRDSWQEYIGSLQLPFYMLLYSESKKIDISNLQGMFLLLGKNIITQKEIELPFFNEESPDMQSYETIKSIIFRLLGEISDSSKPFIPAKNLRKSCPFCDYKNLCGTQWVLSLQ